ncbi:hypothetical protein AB0912_15445 [Streptomyces sp. NPDC007084]|uniref:hypothetical protein n=1 Tax=Streptomyces sp. NPDC007084 TaxID=3154313 RepID=UPI00345728E2
MSLTERTVHVTRREFAVVADPAYGANHVEVGKAWRAVDRAYREVHGITDANASTPDNAIAFFPGDSEIIISFETEGHAQLSVDELARALAEYDRRAGREHMAYADLPRPEQQKYRLAATDLINVLATSGVAPRN